MACFGHVQKVNRKRSFWQSGDDFLSLEGESLDKPKILCAEISNFSNICLRPSVADLRHPKTYISTICPAHYFSAFA
jgi:hypothetical protein